MRDYTRKAKIKDSNEWVIGYHVYVDYLDKHYILVSEKTHDGFSGMLAMKQYEVDGDTICNPTGLTDKNGNKIWENDVVIYDDSPYNVYCTPHKGKIACRNGSLCFKYWLYGSINYMPFTSDLFFDRKCEVIGNIFDNPELLKNE